MKDKMIGKGTVQKSKLKQKKEEINKWERRKKTGR
jgi:hypothetical protein